MIPLSRLYSKRSKKEEKSGVHLLLISSFDYEVNRKQNKNENDCKHIINNRRETLTIEFVHHCHNIVVIIIVIVVVVVLLGLVASV